MFWPGLRTGPVQTEENLMEAKEQFDNSAGTSLLDMIVSELTANGTKPYVDIQGFSCF